MFSLPGALQLRFCWIAGRRVTRITRKRRTYRSWASHIHWQRDMFSIAVIGVTCRVGDTDPHKQRIAKADNDIIIKRVLSHASELYWQGETTKLFSFDDNFSGTKSTGPTALAHHSCECIHRLTNYTSEVTVTDNGCNKKKHELEKSSIWLKILVQS